MKDLYDQLDEAFISTGIGSLDKDIKDLLDKAIKDLLDKAMKDLYDQLNEAFISTGIGSLDKPMSVDEAASLMAFTYVYNGEATVLHPSLYRRITYAQRFANIQGGCIPRADVVLKLQDRIKDIEYWHLFQDQASKPKWFADIETEFNLKPCEISQLFFTPKPIKPK